jgi:mycoredoxin
MKKLIVIAIIILIYQHLNQVDAAEINRQHGSDVVMYSASWCGYCDKARDLLNKQGVTFVELDIEQSAAAHAEMKSLGGHGVPMLVINGEVIKGFNKQRIQTLVRTL